MVDSAKKSIKKMFLSGIKLFCLILGLTVLVCCCSVVLHETTHVIMYESEGLHVFSFHVLDPESFSRGYLGFVEVAGESRLGGFSQEVIAYSVQVLSSMWLLVGFCFFSSFRFTLNRCLLGLCGMYEREYNGSGMVNNV